ncbi:probable leucine-rich repeat receptor-like protein kinase At5g63930 [Eucalyptus grandis]|uniref:probable leucine-rich repeat receptor-like protein kinase At5g63930 n=1 Tax=Eucalyptus grandis TaxID=71139 RepID=UPI00192EE23D|nr:probable leucine-rich repeat receptor-like protein kinase At5g63930 [Eucalyptus grandis]
MGWCTHSNALLVPILFFFSFYPLAFSKLSSPQIEVMVDLSRKIPSSDLSRNSTEDPCEWKGVTCGSDNFRGQALSLSLSGLSLASPGFLPVTCQIGSLQVLDQSELPDACITGGLRRLNFGGSALVGPLPSFTVPVDLFRVLKELQLSVNGFEGEIPEGVKDYRNLALLDLSANQLSGSVPTDLGSSQGWKCWLRLGSNLSSDTIPSDSMGSLKKSTYLEPENNSLTGAVPPELGKCRSLVRDMVKVEAGGNKDFINGTTLSHAVILK